MLIFYTLLVTKKLYFRAKRMAFCSIRFALVLNDSDFNKANPFTIKSIKNSKEYCRLYFSSYNNSTIIKSILIELFLFLFDDAKM